MKKLFALLLALTMLFLTACNNNPADGTLGTGTGTDTGTNNPQNQVQPSELDLKDTIVYNLNLGFIDLPSRIIYEDEYNGMLYYYSKADGNAYAYCYDPLCEHNYGDCMANPDMRFNAWYIFFINNRFYYPTKDGKVISFSFDGTDKKIEYDGEYEEFKNSGNCWGHCMSAGNYIDLRAFASEDGKAHTLRFNVRRVKWRI